MPRLQIKVENRGHAPCRFFFGGFEKHEGPIASPSFEPFVKIDSGKEIDPGHSWSIDEVVPDWPAYSTLFWRMPVELRGVFVLTQFQWAEYDFLKKTVVQQDEFCTVEHQHAPAKV